jgi:hypothetical protein
MEIVRAELPSPELSRYLYTAVGGDFFWVDRLPWTWQRWSDWLTQPGVETWVAWVRGTPAGYAELHAQAAGQVELAYLGLLSSFTDKASADISSPSPWTRPGPSINDGPASRRPTGFGYIPAHWTAHAPCTPTKPRGYACTASRSSISPPRLPGPGPARVDSSLLLRHCPWSACGQRPAVTEFLYLRSASWEPLTAVLNNAYVRGRCEASLASHPCPARAQYSRHVRRVSGRGA